MRDEEVRDGDEHALPREALEPETDALLWQAVGGEHRADVVRVLGAAEGIYQLDLDGTKPFDKAFSSKDPYLALNSLQTDSKRNQQNGLREMLNGVIHLVRNPTAHELRIHWDVNEKNAVDALNLISYLNKLLDCCVIVQRAS